MPRFATTIRALLGASLLAGLSTPAWAFQLNQRWSTTSTNGGGLGQGDPTTLRWSLVPDGTFIEGYNGEPNSNSSLIAMMDGIYGAGPGGADLTQRPWFGVFNNTFGRWAQLSGLTYHYEPADDGVAIEITPLNDGVIGVRGDVRVGAHFIDGQVGPNVLAYNFFPQFGGDMVIDSSNTIFYGDTTNNSVRLRNVLTHEEGHGIGLNHVESSNANFLMEPFINVTFDGPQLDDILGAQRHYGDALEKGGGNDSFAFATSLGPIGTAAIGTLGDSTGVAFTDTDFISIDGVGDQDFFSFSVLTPGLVDITLDPRGASYNQGPQGGPQSAFNASNNNDLRLMLLGPDGVTILSNQNAAGVGGNETILGFNLNPGTYYVRVSGDRGAVQLYGLNLDFTPGVPITPEPATATLLAMAGLALLRRRR